MDGVGCVQAATWTEAAPVAYLRIRNELVRLFLRNAAAGNVQLDGMPGAALPVVVWPEGLSWDEVTRVLTRNPNPVTAARGLVAGWRKWVNYAMPFIRHEFEITLPTVIPKGSRQVEQAKLKIYEELRDEFRPGVGSATVAEIVVEKAKKDPAVAAKIAATGVNPTDIDQVKVITEAARVWKRRLERQAAA